MTVALPTEQLAASNGCPLRLLLNKIDGLKAVRIHRALRTAVTTITAEDRHLLQLRFGEGRRIVDIARALDLDQPALYRRYAQLLNRLRRALEGMEVTADDVRPLLGEGLLPSDAGGLVTGPLVGKFDVRPSFTHDRRSSWLTRKDTKVAAYHATKAPEAATGTPGWT